jgi:hypothetical protein
MHARCPTAVVVRVPKLVRAALARLALAAIPSTSGAHASSFTTSTFYFDLSFALAVALNPTIGAGGTSILASLSGVTGCVFVGVASSNGGVCACCSASSAVSN